MNPLGIVATIGAFAAIIKGAIQIVRRDFPKIDGRLVQGLAILFGFGIAAGLDFRATAALLDSIGANVGRIPTAIFDYLITGVAMAFTAGIFAEVSGTSGPSRGVTVINQSPTD